MFDSIALNVVISLVFIYSLYSLLVTTLNEMIASAFNLRAKTLEKGIKRMLTDNGAGISTTLKQFYDLPIIKYLGENNTKKPSYLSSTTFSNALVHLCKELSGASGTATNAQQQLLSGIQQIKAADPETGKYLEILYNDANGQIDLFQESAQNWFNETMDRATGWYKRQVQKITFLVALGIAISFNVDSIGIVKNLSLNPKLATQVVQMADAYAKANQTQKAKAKTIVDDKTKTDDKAKADVNSVPAAAPAAPESKVAIDTATATAKTAVDTTANAVDKTTPMADAKTPEEQIQDAYANAQKLIAANSDIANANSILGLGWKNTSIRFTQVLGWLVTALAISLGSPFWFDLLNKLMQLRGSKKIETDS